MNKTLVWKTFIRINWEEHNLKSLLDLLKFNNIKIDSIISSDPRLDSIERVTDNFIPSLNSKITVDATYLEIRKILESSNEFKWFVNKLLWVV